MSAGGPRRSEIVGVRRNARRAATLPIRCDVCKALGRAGSAS